MRLTNWADNHTFQGARVHRPASVDEARRIVAGSPRVHAIGARHSFNAVADTAGDLIDLSGLDPAFVVDPEQSHRDRRSRNELWRARGLAAP